MNPEAKSLLWNALFENDGASPAPETVAWLMSSPDRQFVQLLATHCTREQLLALVGASRQVLRQVLQHQFAPLRDGIADGNWRRGVQRAMDELLELRPDLTGDLPAFGDEDDVWAAGDLVTMELAKVMARLPKEQRTCV